MQPSEDFFGAGWLSGGTLHNDVWECVLVGRKQVGGICMMYMYSVGDRTFEEDEGEESEDQ